MPYRPTIFETEYWRVDLAEDQLYLGRCYVPLKRSCGDLAEVSEEEILDFLVVVRRFECGVREAFGATMFNWACLMNNAYQEPDLKPQVHWHVRPRYAQPTAVAGETFADPNFGHHYLREDTDKRIVSSEMLAAIARTLREHLAHPVD